MDKNNTENIEKQYAELVKLAEVLSPELEEHINLNNQTILSTQEYYSFIALENEVPLSYNSNSVTY